MTIRDATPDDAHAIAAVQVKTWHTTYRGLMPDSFLDAQTLEGRAAHWQRIFSNPTPHSTTLVAEDDTGRVVGFACGGAQREDDLAHDGELYAIYILDTHQGQGLGRDLTQAIIEHLRGAGFKSMILWVLAANEGARRFYEAIGGEPVLMRKYDLDGTLLDKIGYCWNLG